MLQSDDIISILELFESGHSYREIRIVYSVGNSSLCRIRQKAQESAVHSEDLKKMSAQQVIELFYPKASVACTCDKTLPDFEKIYQRMKNPEIHTSLISEWESYKKKNPGGYQYTQFKVHYNRWKKKSHPGDDVSMPIDRMPGKYMYLDWVGDRPPLVKDPDHEGELLKVHFFVTTVGYSSLTFAKAYPDEKTDKVADAVVSSLSYCGKIPEALRPDNMKTAVISNSRKGLVLSPLMLDLGEFYSVKVLPARPHSPKDKATVERAVKIIEDEFLSRLEGTVFESFDELNKKAAQFVDELNSRRKPGQAKSRRQLFDEFDAPAMRDLPEQIFTVFDYILRTVPRNYHVKFDQHYYSVPYTLYKEKVTVKATPYDIVICDQNNTVVARHKRSYSPSHLYITETAHRPQSHQAAAEIEAEGTDYFLKWADRYGPNTRELIECMLLQPKYPEHAFNACMAVLQECKKAPAHCAEQAAFHCLESGKTTWTFFSESLKTCLAEEYKKQPALSDLKHHENLRGKDYYK